MLVATLAVKSQTLIYDFAFNNSLSTTVGTGTFSSANVSFTNGRFGSPNTAIKLNNTGTTATLTGLPLGSAARTIALWVKMDALRTDFNFIYNYGTSNAPEGLYIKPSDIIHFAPSHSKAATFNTSSWFHLVVTYTGTASKIYVNGVLIGTQNITKNTVNNANLFRLGLTESGGTNYFNGSIDELKIYSGALSDQQAIALYSSCIPPTPISNTPPANLSICSGNTTILNVQSDSVVNWFNTASGGTSLGSGNSFVTPILTTTTTYYAEAGLNCKSARLPFTVNVNPATVPLPPQIITDTTKIYCIGTKLALSVQSTSLVRWYDAANGGNLLGTGDSLITPPLQNNSTQGQTVIHTYYAETYSPCANPQSSVRVPIHIKVNGDFTITNIMPSDRLFVCSGSSIQLIVNTNADTMRWTYNGTVVSQNWVHNTPALTSSRTYIFTASKNGVCTKQEFFPVQVYNSYSVAPTNTSGTLPSLCTGDTVKLSATSQHNAPLYWFNVPTDGTAYHIGDTALTPVFGNYNASTTTYYVQSGQGACASPRTPISVNFTYAPRGTISVSGNTISAYNLYDTYVLRKDGQVVAQSNTTGTINFANAPCGQYQATFTNTVNTACNSTAAVRISKNPTMYGNNCYTFNITTESWLHYGTISASVANGPFGSAASIDPTQLTYLASVCGVSANTNITFRLITPNGCAYAVTRTFSSIPNGNVNTHLNAPLSYASQTGFDTLTTCNIRSNVITIGLNQPTVNTTPIGNLSVCKGQTTTLIANGNGTLKWYAQPIGGIALDSGNSFKTPAIFANTTYYVEASSGNCVSARTPLNVNLKTSPTASISPNSASICAGKNIELTASGGDTYSWVEPSSNQSKLIVSPITTTTYKAVAALSNGCRDTALVTVTVKPTSATPLFRTVCFGQSIIFKGETISQSGIYRDTLQNILGCDSIITLDFIVKPKLEKVINVGICSGQSYTFKDQQINQAGQYFDTLTSVEGCDSFVVLNLSVNSFVLGNATVAICEGKSYTFNGKELNKAGEYIDTLMSVAGCDSILTLTLLVNDLPQPSISRNGNELSTQVFANYQWQRNGINISGATSRTYTATQDGDYTVLVSDTNSCSNTSAAINVILVGVENVIEKDLKLRIYPNPATSSLNIESNEAIESIKVFDLYGRIILSVVEPNSNNAQFSVLELNPASYFLELKTQTGKSTMMNFIKQ
jgi:hypothetical protein